MLELILMLPRDVHHGKEEGTAREMAADSGQETVVKKLSTLTLIFCTSPFTFIWMANSIPLETMGTCFIVGLDLVLESEWT
jgi:hypothetical protein